MIMTFFQAESLFAMHGVHLVLRDRDEVYAMEKIDLSRPGPERKTPAQVKAEAVKVGVKINAPYFKDVRVELVENVEEILKSKGEANVL